MEDVKSQTGELLDHVEAFSDTLLKMVFVNITQKGVALAAGLINTIFVYVAGSFALLFAGAGLAWWIGDLLNNHAAGFFIVAGIFLLLVLCIILLKKNSIAPLIRNMIVRKIYE